MILKHIALVCSSEKNSDTFYEDILGLKKTGSKMIPSTLSKQIFNLDSEYKIVNYADDKIHFEIFIDSRKSFEDDKIEHACLKVDDLEAFLKKCGDNGLKIINIPKGDGRFLTFVRDYDGNLFEIKENWV